MKPVLLRSGILTNIFFSLYNILITNKIVFRRQTPEEKCNGAALQAFSELKNSQLKATERDQRETDKAGNNCESHTLLLNFIESIVLLLVHSFGSYIIFLEV